MASLLFCCRDETMTRSDLGRKGFSWLTLPDHGPSLKGEDRNLEAETEVEIMEGCCMLACFPCLAQLGSLDNLGPHIRG